MEPRRLFDKKSVEPIYNPVIFVLTYELLLLGLNRSLLLIVKHPMFPCGLLWTASVVRTSSIEFPCRTAVLDAVAETAVAAECYSVLHPRGASQSSNCRVHQGTFVHLKERTDRCSSSDFRFEDKIGCP